MGIDYERYYDIYFKELQKKAEIVVKEKQKEAMKDFFEVAETKIKKIYKSTIDTFYGSYNPHFYDRTGNLYYLFQTKRTDDYLSIWFDPSKISYRNGYSESSNSDGVKGGLYDLIFRHGWHGGALVNGSMLYPVGKENGSFKAYDGTYKDGRYKPYEEISYKWAPAVKASISPLDDFKIRLDKYMDTEWQTDYDKIWERKKSEIKLK